MKRNSISSRIVFVHVATVLWVALTANNVNVVHANLPYGATGNGDNIYLPYLSPSHTSTLLSGNDNRGAGVVPRGGGPSSYSGRNAPFKVGFFGSLFRRQKSVSQYYRETLEEQVLLLDRQLRQARAGVAQLREERASLPRKALRAKTRRSKSSSSSSSKISAAAAAEQQKQHEQKVKTLSTQIKLLEQMKEELEQMLKTSTERIEQLEMQVLEQEQENQALAEKYQEKLEELKVKMEEKAAQQLETIERLMEERVEQAAHNARQAALVEVDEHLSQLTEKLQKEHQKELAAERRRSAEAVEQEKKKMRKLVKALAIREKKLMAKSNTERQQQQQKSSRTSLPTGETSGTVIPNTSTQSNKPKTTPTTRGPI